MKWYWFAVSWIELWFVWDGIRKQDSLQIFVSMLAFGLFVFLSRDIWKRFIR